MNLVVQLNLCCSYIIYRIRYCGNTLTIYNHLVNILSHPRKNFKYCQYIARTMDEILLIDEP